MTPHYSDPLVTLYLGDCLEVMPTLEVESVDAVDRSPAPAFCALCTIALGGSVRWHPTVPSIAANTTTVAIHLTDYSSHYYLMGSRPERSAIARNWPVREELLGCGLIRCVLLEKGSLIRLFARKVSEHDLTQLHQLLRLLFRDVGHYLYRPNSAVRLRCLRPQRRKHSLLGR